MVCFLHYIVLQGNIWHEEKKKGAHRVSVFRICLFSLYFSCAHLVLFLSKFCRWEEEGECNRARGAEGDQLVLPDLVTLRGSHPNGSGEEKPEEYVPERGDVYTRRAHNDNRVLSSKKKKPFIGKDYAFRGSCDPFFKSE